MTQRKAKAVAPLYEIHCGILPLANRFIVVDCNGTRWIIPASVVLDLACKYYEEEGWYEGSELRKEGLTQLHGDELRSCIEVNGDLTQIIREEQWSEVRTSARKVGNADDPNDKGWWFEEHGGTIEEMTDLPIENQAPLALLWFDDAFKQAHS